MDKMDNDIKFEDLSDSDFDILRNKAIGSQLSPFAKFCFDSIGYRYKNRAGYDLDKWEVFNMGYTDVDAIISGQTPIRAFKKIGGGDI